MPRKKSPPTYRLHKARNCAVVTINRRNHYLGPYESAESYEKYARLIADWEAPTADRPPTVPVQSAGYPDLSVNEMLLRYWNFARGYYTSDGTPTKELACMKEAMRPLKALYGHSRARDFGPLALKAARQHMVDADLSRGVVNHRVNRIRRIFKWAVGEELIPPERFEALRAVTGLRYGRTSARETKPDTFRASVARANTPAASSVPLSVAGQEKIQPHHFERLAIVYVRQSTPQQVLKHRESTDLQYQLVRYAVGLGWSKDRVIVIDDDQGQTATTAEGRLGFQQVLTEVGLHHVGLVLGVEMSRLRRSLRR